MGPLVILGWRSRTVGSAPVGFPGGETVRPIVAVPFSSALEGPVTALEPAPAADADVRPRTFDQVFRSIADVQGWMTRAQACRLWDRASELKAGDRIVEIGSYHGRSAIVLASAAPEGVEVITIDPHGGNDRGPQQYEGEFEEGQRDHETFVANLTRAGVVDRIRHVRKASQDAPGDIPGDVEMVYIDGAHR